MELKEIVNEAKRQLGITAADEEVLLDEKVPYGKLYLHGKDYF